MRISGGPLAWNEVCCVKMDRVIHQSVSFFLLFVSFYPIQQQQQHDELLLRERERESVRDQLTTLQHRGEIKRMFSLDQRGETRKSLKENRKEMRRLLRV